LLLCATTVTRRYARLGEVSTGLRRSVSDLSLNWCLDADGEQFLTPCRSPTSALLHERGTALRSLALAARADHVT
jgi:hypothetical protein